MGLDLILYKKPKNVNELVDDEFDQNEIAYGRKTWAIANFFRGRCKPIDDDFEYIVTRQDWNEFITALSQLEDPNFRQKVEVFINSYDGEDEVDVDNYYAIKSWLDNALNNEENYILGLTWEVRAVLDWFDANEEVQNAFDNEFDVILMTSY
jgi:hypothetical protein